MVKHCKHYTPDEKVPSLRRHLVEKVPVSDLCQKQKLQPTVFYRWFKEFFENEATAFRKEGDREGHRDKQRIAALEAKLKAKNEVLSELMEEHVTLKKVLERIKRHLAISGYAGCGGEFREPPVEGDGDPEGAVHFVVEGIGQ